MGIFVKPSPQRAAVQLTEQLAAELFLLPRSHCSHKTVGGVPGMLTQSTTPSPQAAARQVSRHASRTVSLLQLLGNTSQDAPASPPAASTQEPPSCAQA